jgi:hypothetical protein
MNFAADMMADKAAVSAAHNGKGERALPATRTMIKNFLKRRATEILRESWFRLYTVMNATVCPPGSKRKKVVGHNYLEAFILWTGWTCDWTIQNEKIRRETSTLMDRWLAVPKELVLCSTSRMASKALVRLRLMVPSRNIWKARDMRMSAPMCPGCREELDSGQHRFLCKEFLPQRRALANRLYSAIYTTKDAAESLSKATAHSDTLSNSSKDSILRDLFTWNILVKGDYRVDLQRADKLERYTAPPKETRKELAAITHAYLANTKFYKKVYGRKADVCQQVKDTEVLHPHDSEDEHAPSSSDEESESGSNLSKAYAQFVATYDDSSDGSDYEAVEEVSDDSEADPSFIPSITPKNTVMRSTRITRMTARTTNV